MSQVFNSGRSIIAVACTLVLATGAVRAQRRQPVPSTDEQQAIINEGNTLHDNQDFDGAIGKYTRVLDMNPDNVDALFELATCYYDKSDYRGSLEAALRGAAYESDNLGLFYILVGTNYDELREPLKAVDAYRTGIKAEPNRYLLHYNLAVTYLNLKQVDNARESFKRALVLNPNHASSNIGLGQIYFARGYRVPALLAFCRALVLEPGSGRSESTARMLESLLGIDEPGGDAASPGSIKPSALHDEGNFEQSEKVLAAIGAEGDRHDGTTQIELLAQRIGRVLAPLANADPRKLDGGFAAEYYAPYFADAVRRGHVEAMSYHIFQSMPKDGLADWLHANITALDAFLAWSKNFTWHTIHHP